MLISTSAEAAKQREVNQIVDDQPYIGREYIGSAPKPGSASYGKNIIGNNTPQAYLVTQPPNSITRPHFHKTNQFQLFVAGSGRVGKLRADPLTIQYAGSNTPYGPIIAEGEGIQYFTLRQAWDSGAKYLPAMKDMLVKGKQRQIIGAKKCFGDVEKLKNYDSTRIELLSEPTNDGLLMQVLGLPPKAQITLPDASAGGGQYHIIISGTLLRSGQILETMSVEFASADEGPIKIEAGPNGLEFVLLRFPKG